MAKIEHRSLHFDSLTEGLLEVDRLAACEIRTTGKYSYGQILEHLARSLDITTGELSSPPFPRILAWGAKLLLKMFPNRFLHKPMTPGIKLPSKIQIHLWPSDDVSVADGLQHLKNSCERFLQMPQLPPHPIFGSLTAEAARQLQCRHFELHLGFVFPK